MLLLQCCSGRLRLLQASVIFVAWKTHVSSLIGGYRVIIVVGLPIHICIVHYFKNKAFWALTLTGELVQIELHVVKFVLISILASSMVLALRPQTCRLLMVDNVLIKSLHRWLSETGPWVFPMEARFGGRIVLLPWFLHREHIWHRVDMTDAFWRPWDRLLDWLMGSLHRLVRDR